MLIIQKEFDGIIGIITIGYHKDVIFDNRTYGDLNAAREDYIILVAPLTRKTAKQKQM